LSSERTQPVLSLAAKLQGLPPVVDAHADPHGEPIVLFSHERAQAKKGRISKQTEIDLPSKIVRAYEDGP
jgi:hypothetical protein